MPPESAAPKPGQIIIGLNAVLASISEDTPLVLCTHIVNASPRSVQNARSNRSWGLPYGAFDPESHRTFEIGLRKFVAAQTNIKVDYVEQLYTFGDKGRSAPLAALQVGSPGSRVISVGYLALAAMPMKVQRKDTAWRSWYQHFPWEDWRLGEPTILTAEILPYLHDWATSARSAAKQAARHARIQTSFGLETGWEEDRVLDRYELMFEAGLVAERHDQPQRIGQNLPHPDSAHLPVSTPMISDHRRILATAIDRIRGKLKYRPIIRDLMPEHFTLLELQSRIEAILGYALHKQNFRRLVEKSSLFEKTEEIYVGTGRPAAIFRAVRSSDAQGLALPRLRRSPSHMTSARTAAPRDRSADETP